MPKRKSVQEQRESSNRAVTKYRRLHTLKSKMMELAEKCGLNMCLLVEDSHFNKIMEYYTSEKTTFESVRSRMGHSHFETANQNQKLNALKMVSVKLLNAAKRDKSVAKSVKGEKAEEANFISSIDDQMSQVDDILEEVKKSGGPNDSKHLHDTH